MNNWRVKPLDAILATAEKKALHRSLDAVSLTLLGVGAVIGTGIFVLTAEAAQKAGPAMMISFVIAGVVCAVAALCYSELAAMVPVSGSAYTYTYAVMGEILAWIVGWALVLEYSVASAAVSVGWSGYFVGLLDHELGIHLPAMLAKGPFDGGLINLPAFLIAFVVMALLIRGTKESATFNTFLVIIKITALTLFVFLAYKTMMAKPDVAVAHYKPFSPTGFGGVSAAAASIFFAYMGFDAVSTAAEETKDPQKNMPIGLLGSLAICTIFYLLVAAGVIGTVGAQPMKDAAGHFLAPGTKELTDVCNATGNTAVVCSKEALAWTLRSIGHPKVGSLVGIAAGIALPSVVLMLMYGQTRIFFVMSRDGLLPEIFSRIHPKFHTPHIITIITGLFVSLFAAFGSVGALAEITNAGTLFAFAMVALAVMVLRKKDPERVRPFKTPAVYFVAPVAMLGCAYLFFNLSIYTLLLFVVWGGLGLIIYFSYSRKHSHVGRGLIEVHEEDEDAPPTSLPPI